MLFIDDDVFYRFQKRQAYKYAVKQKRKRELYEIKYGTKYKKKKVKFSKILIPFIIAIVIIYVIANFILLKNGMTEMSSTLHTCFFVFFTSDLALLCGIKITDTVRGVDKPTISEIADEINSNISDDAVG